jgi:GR25 family glycosyltransferase involved in LPS biosynthesis
MGEEPERLCRNSPVAHALSTRLAIRKAKLRGAAAVFIFEDDVVFHSDWRERLAEIELPDDWGIFYLGCQHQARPKVLKNEAGEVIRGLVKVTESLDTHAWGIKAQYFDKVLALLRGRKSRFYGKLPPADVWLALSEHGIPMVAAYPNLAWQAEEHSDLVKGVFSNYHERCGTQKVAQSVLDGVLAETPGMTPVFLPLLI